ncbi:MAG TPA: hypothetical protein VEI54_10805 [Candidatus Limnocylindrales bacterium]|nr:hypothetical protein [Candidatus Limnocylindrales bacterium]
MTLHEFHARSLASTLTLADASVRRMERLLTNGGEEGLIRYIQNTLSREECAALLHDVHSLRDTLTSLAEALALQRSALDIRRVLDAELTTLWVLFEDCRPARMKGYGQEFSPEDQSRLDETVNELTAKVDAMKRRLL